MSTHEPPLAPEVASAKGLRTGWTTGTCASAAAKAATTWLVHGQPPARVEVALPSAQRVAFDVVDVDRERPYRCAVVKDAGDDPDVTHGAHITAEVTWAATPTPADAGNPAPTPTGTRIGNPTTATTPTPTDTGNPAPTPTGTRIGNPTTATTDTPSGTGNPAPTPIGTRIGNPATATTATPSGTGNPATATTATPADARDPATDADIGGLAAPGGTGGSSGGTRLRAAAVVTSGGIVAADGVELRAGPGVGTVTLPGLGLPVGAPAINPVPRRMIAQAVREVTDRPVVVTVSVPGGEAMAAKTSNDRLGIVGGISILGTTGIVKPFSTASYRASVVQQVDVAAAQGRRHIVLSTGSRSDRAAQRLLPDLPPVCFVEVGDFTGIALRRAATAGLERATWVGMAGKIAKLAAGVLMTHYRRSKIDGALLAEVARGCDAPPAVVEAATATATARHFAEVCLDHGVVSPLSELCRRAAAACTAHTGGALPVEVVMVDFEGEQVIARG